MIVTQKEFCMMCGTHVTCGCFEAGDFRHRVQIHKDIWDAHHQICTKELMYVVPGDIERHVPELCGECLQDRCACGEPRHCGSKVKSCPDCNCILCIEAWKKREFAIIQNLSNKELFDEVMYRNCGCTDSGGTWVELNIWADKQREMLLRDKLRDFLHG